MPVRSSLQQGRRGSLEYEYQVCWLGWTMDLVASDYSGLGCSLLLAAPVPVVVWFDVEGHGTGTSSRYAYAIRSRGLNDWIIMLRGAIVAT
eukprot:scaffold179601_cov23-Prasinocladus_malaysianus.AAC.1